MSSSLPPSATLLKKLYIKDKLSTYKIAAILECDPKTIYRYLVKYNIKTRPISKASISKNILLNLYQNKRLSLKQIGNLYGMTASGVLKRMRKHNISMRNSWEINTGVKRPFNGTLKERAYMIGFRLGDLGVRQSSKKTKMILVGSNTTKKEQVKLIKNLFEKYAKVWISKPNPIGVVSVSTILHPSFSFLLPKVDNIEKWIRLNNETMWAFIAGYTDAEGSFGVYNKRGRFRLGSYDKGILSQIVLWFKKHDIKPVLAVERKKTGQNKDFWRITVNEARSLLVLNREFYNRIRHKKRLSDLERIVENINSRLKNGTIQL
jgi:predicted HTH domain antitoxin